MTDRHSRYIADCGGLVPVMREWARPDYEGEDIRQAALRMGAAEIERLTAENERLRAALFDIAIGVGENILDQEAMRARAFDALGAVRREQKAPGVSRD